MSINTNIDYHYALCYYYVSRVIDTGYFERYCIFRNQLYFLACVVSGNEGCHEDVIDILDNACSNKQKCDFSVFNTDLDNVKPCCEDLLYIWKSATNVLQVNLYLFSFNLRENGRMLKKIEWIFTGNISGILFIYLICIPCHIVKGICYLFCT